MKPLVTLITPSYNQARFLPDAIESVLAQDYENLEYWVIDGGSTDGSVELLERYGDRLQWVSEPDRGQAHAINKGIERARGSLVGWLNSDDALLPGALSRMVERFEKRPELGLVYGRGNEIDEDGRSLGAFAGTEPFNLWRLLFVLDFVLQPATLFQRDLVQRLGMLDESLHWAMDWDLWLRLAAAAEVELVDAVLACSRVYAQTKTSTGGWRRIRELSRLARRYTGRRLTPGVALYGLDQLARQLSAWPHPLRRPGNAAVQRLWRSLVTGAPVHADGWLRQESWIAVPRRWPRFELTLEAPVVPPAGLEVTLSVEGRRLARLGFDQPGVRSLAVETPRGEEAPWIMVRVRASACFTPQPPDQRRELAIRMLALRAAGSGLPATVADTSLE